MKLHSSRQSLMLFFMPAFLIGVLYISFTAKRYIADPGIFGEYFLRQIVETEIVTGDYLWYLVRLRVIPFCVLAGFMATRTRRLWGALFTAWCGLAAGIVISEAVYCMGVKGSFFCLWCLFPQFLFYVPAYCLLLHFCFSSPQSRWNRQKTIFVILMTVMGIGMELYVNPVLVKLYVTLFCSP